MNLMSRFAVQDSKTGKFVCGLKDFVKSYRDLEYPNDYWIPEWLERQNIWTDHLLKADLFVDPRTVLKWIPGTESVPVVINS